jgi:hypothetical protein
MRNRILALGLVGLGALAWGNTALATQAESNVSLKKPEATVIMGLGNITLLPTDLHVSDTFCVFSSAPGNFYAIRITTANGGYVLKSGGNTMAYYVDFRDQDSSLSQIAYNFEWTLQLGSTICTTGNEATAELQVVIPQGNYDAAPGSATSYTDTIYVTVSP